MEEGGMIGKQGVLVFLLVMSLREAKGVRE